MADAQITSLLERIRVLIGDMDDDVNLHRHSDNYIKKALRVAIEQDKGLQTIGLGGTVTSTGDAYTEYTVGTLSAAAESMYALATSLLIFEAELRQYIADGGGIATAIGPNTVDEKTVLQSMHKLLKDSKIDFQKGLVDYNLGVVITPVRVNLYNTGKVSD